MTVVSDGGWPEVKVGDVLTLRNGRAFRSSEWQTSGKPIIRIQNLKSREAPSNYFSGELPDQFAVRAGDLLFAWSGTPGTSFGAHIWDGPDAWLNQHIFRVDFSTRDFDRDFLKYALSRNVGSYIQQAQGGVGLAHITKAKLNASLLPRPPLDEQRRIAKCLDEIGTRRAFIADRLVAARAIVDRLRGAVLAAACSGRLTADWRDEHEKDFESLPRSLDAVTEVSQPPVTSAEADSVGDLPAHWRPVSLGLLTQRIEAGKSVRAEGQPAGPSEWGVIKVSAMSWGSFLETENKAISDPALINPRYEIRADDLLISRANTVDLVGATVHVQHTRPRLLLSDKSLRLVPRDGIDKAWLNLALSAPGSRSQLAGRATGTSESMRNLSQPKILATKLALPPIGEQREIVRRATAALAIAKHLSEAIGTAEIAVAGASRAALALAFRAEVAGVAGG